MSEHPFPAPVEDALCAAVVAELGECWVHQRVDRTGAPCYALAGPDRECLHLVVGIDRVIVRSFAPAGVGPPTRGQIRREITATLAKTPARIARDITVRLLRGYREVLAAAIAEQDQHDAAAARAAALADQLRALLAPLGSLCETPQRSGPPQLQAGRYNDPVEVVAARVWADQPAELQLRVAPALLARLARYLTDLAAAAAAAAGAADTGAEVDVGSARR
ncbi:hypothetical protein [uncultured Pseudonocardia sp.]|jgi:hypothetical protein|uniref:hypothetical protein n=1 Tax=uncultured Pseudonocardia sp. TaxID=211455 RepID=UPI0026223C5A|nr:hypothetical protein [uncultured Pseudonocardia sp.]